MKKIYSITLLSLLIITGCSKDFLKNYDERIIGTWEIIDLDKRGFGNSNNLPFTDGLFTFGDNGQFTWTVNATTYQGSWDIRREHIGDNPVRTLQLTAVDFTTQDVRTEHFSEIVFTNTNRMRATIYDGSRRYVYRFLRK